MATTYLKLPFLFDENKLVQELNELLKPAWIPHFNTNGYDGDWNSIALYATNGDYQNILALQLDDTEITETSLLKTCPYFRAVLSNFECPFLSVRLLRLGPGSYIKPHRDANLGYENGCFRIHVPITTNPGVTFMLDGNQLDMQPGECWYTNVNYVHSVANKGLTDRVHLVVDGKRNEWSDQLFFSLAPKEELLTPEQQQYDADTLKKIIKALENREGTEQLVLDLQEQLQKMNGEG